MSTFNELIDFTRSTTGTYLDSVVYGDELVTNGDFATDSDWTKQPEWTIANGVATFDDANNANLQQFNMGLVIGKSYLFRFDITSGTTPNFGFFAAGSSDQYTPYTVYSVGTHQLVFTCAGGTGIRIAASKFLGSSFSIDNISVKEVIGGQVSAGTPLLRTAAINEPRLEYDASGNPLGLLIEEVRTNIISNSEALVVSSNRAIAESSISPTGEQTAQTWRVNGSESASPYWYGSPNIVSGTTYTCSVFVRLPTSGPTVETRYVKLTSQTRMQAGTAVFDLQEGAVVSSNMLSESITPVGNGWYRLSATNIATSSGSSFSFILWPCINAAGDLYVISASDDGKALLETFGMQTEVGAFPTSYIPTSGSTVTRAADVSDVPVERFGYNTGKGSIVVYAQSNKPAVSVYAFELSVDSADRMFSKFHNQEHLRVRVNNADTAVIDAGNIETGSFAKLGARFANNDFAVSIDGNTPVTDTNGAVNLNASELKIGQSQSNGEHLNGHIKQIQYYPKRLSNEELQLLTQPSASPTMNLTFDGQATSTLVEGLHD